MWWILGTVAAVLVTSSCAAPAPAVTPPQQYFYLRPNSVVPLPTPPPSSLQQVRYMPDDDDEPEATQFHTQDAEGRFAFGYSMPDQVRIESRNKDGTVRGSYSYLDPNGLTVKVQYWDAGDGFHSAGNHLPVHAPAPVQDTPEVQAARDEHFRIFQEVLERNVAYAAYLEERRRREQADAASVTPVDDGRPSDEGVIVESDTHATFDDNGNELKRYPQIQVPQNLFDPTQVHDQKLEAVIVENPDMLGPSFDGNSLRSAKRLMTAESPSARRGFSYSFSHPIPTYLEVKTVMDEGDQYVKPQAKLDADELRAAVKTQASVSQRAQDQGKIPVAAVHDAQVPPSLRASVKNHQVLPVDLGDQRDDVGSAFRTTPARTSLSLSERAAYFGAIPVAAVHDAQVPPRFRGAVKNHQVLPVYIEHGGQE